MEAHKGQTLGMRDSFPTREGPYLALLQKHMDRWPSFRLLIDFTKAVHPNPVRVGVLEFHATHVSSLVFGTLEELEQYWTAISSRDRCRGRLYLLEDLSTPHIEAFGSKFHVNPSLFVEYIRFDPDRNQNFLHNYCAMRRLPSMLQQSTHSTLVYQELRLFPSNAPRTEQFDILTHANVPRRVTSVEHCGYRELTGLVRRNFSVWLQPTTSNSDEPWNVLTIMDPKLNGHFAIRSWKTEHEYRIIACPSEPYLHGHLAVSPWNMPNYEDSVEFLQFPRRGLFDDLIHHWMYEATRAEITAAVDNPTDVALFATRILASNWNLTLEYLNGVVSKLDRGLLHFEQMTGNPSAQAIKQEVNRLRVLLADVNSWRRRLWFYLEQMKFNQESIGALLCHRKSQHTRVAPTVEEKAIEDFATVYERLLLCRDRIQSLMPVVMGVFSLLEAEQSGLENKTALRLSALAFIFVPLSFAANLLSMSDDYLPGKSHFWVYFSISVPLIVILMLWLFKAEAKAAWKWCPSRTFISRRKGMSFAA